MSASDRHNEIAAEFVRTTGKATKSNPELMVAVESMMLGAMLMSIRIYGVEPAHASIMMEAALHRATERLAGSS